jgi:hypothetical protein
MTNAHAAAEDRVMLPGFEPETVLPAQFLDTSHLGAGLQPEKRLMLAVLEDAIASYRRSATGSGKGAARELASVSAWFASDDTSWPFAFLNICHVLGFEPDCLQRGLDAGTVTPASADGGRVVSIRNAFRRISGSRTRAVVPRRLRDA